MNMDQKMAEVMSSFPIILLTLLLYIVTVKRRVAIISTTSDAKQWAVDVHE